VRSLAQRSAAAAKEIKALIGDSVDKVGAGTKLVDEAGKTMEEIVASVKRVTDIMSEIAAASQEQSAGIEQVNQAITQMEEVTQQNAALVEQEAAATGSLEQQARGVAAAVGMFRLTRTSAELGANFDFESATQAHVNWKHKLVDYLGGKGEKLDQAVLAKDNRCALGEWIYGHGKTYAGSDEYRSLQSVHADFHRCTGEVVRLADGGQEEAARQLLHGEFEAKSKQTVSRIYALRKVVEGRQKAGKPAASRRTGSPAASKPVTAGARPQARAMAKAVRTAGGRDEWTEF
jgi:methyl-accepting chemotaxis protein